MTIIIALDGCTDDTKIIAQAAIARVGRDFDIRIVDYTRNRGKIAILNDQIGAAGADIVALTDASALIEPEALAKAASHFRNPSIGVVCATYALPSEGSEGERLYWRMQTQLKADEAKFGAPMGAHGSLYFFRRGLWEPLPADTINDDFVLPMRIVADGYRAVYDQSIVATELEASTNTQEFRRRVRIGAGNMQQLVRLYHLADPRSSGIAFVFVSGKGLRPIVPFLILLAVAATMLLAIKGEGLFQVMLAGEIALFGLAGLGILGGARRLPRPVAWLAYLVSGHAASAMGAVAFLTGRWQGPWKPATAGTRYLPRNGGFDLVPPEVAKAKRIFDVVAACAGLLVLALVWIPVALAIKLESRGPVFFRQTRVGRSTRQATYLFELIKFRSMCDGAEKLTGPTFAERNDPRITRVGQFLRKTRLDELPQLINVLRGDMSLIGPRPERPCFVSKLDREIPFYTQRTTGMRPGLTGLAQVNQTYEQSVNDVHGKVAFDHAYAIKLSNFQSWVRTDIDVLLKTIRVVVKRTGQ